MDIAFSGGIAKFPEPKGAHGTTDEDVGGERVSLWQAPSHPRMEDKGGRGSETQGVVCQKKHINCCLISDSISPLAVSTLNKPLLSSSFFQGDPFWSQIWSSAVRRGGGGGDAFFCIFSAWCIIVKVKRMCSPTLICHLFFPTKSPFISDMSANIDSYSLCDPIRGDTELTTPPPHHGRTPWAEVAFWIPT